MAKSNDSWGIEVGSGAIKAMRLVRANNTAEPELAEYDIIPFDQILTSPDVDVETAVRQKLELFLSRHEVTESELVVSVPGHMAFARFAKLPPVEAKQVPNVVKYEAQQQIPFPIEQVEWDYQVFQQGQDNQLGVGIFAMNKERVGQVLNYYQQFDLELNALTLSPLAVYNAFQYDNANQAEQAGTIYMDIGAMSTDVIIVEHGGIWLRTLPIGGNHFTEALVRAFKLSYPKAEKLKREAGTSKYARQIFQAMRPVFADLVQEIQRSLGYYQSLHRESNLTRLVGVGSTFRLPGLRKFLKQQLQVEVQRINGFNRIQAEGKQASEFAEHSMNLVTAYGLALQGLGEETVTANLMPMHTLQARFWQAKQPWFAAAAACVLLAALIAGGRYFLFSSSWGGLQAQTQQIAQRALSNANNAQRAWRGIDIESQRVQINNYRRMLDYQHVHTGLINDIDVANQAVLDSTDADQSRVFIASIDPVYEPTPNTGQQTTDRRQTAPPSGPRGRQARSAGRDNPFGRNVDIEQYFGENGQGPPRFVITIRGTTSLDNAEQVLGNNNTFQSILESHPEEAGRPYRTVNVALNSMSTSPITDLPEGRVSGTQSEANAPSGRQTSPAASEREQRYTADVRDVDFYLPDTAPYGGAQSVREFEIKWTVELLAPKQARSEPGDSTAPPSSSPEAAGRAPAMDEPRAAATSQAEEDAS